MLSDDRAQRDRQVSRFSPTAILTFAAVREILRALRDDGNRRTTAAHCIINATVALEAFILASERRTKAATALLREKHGKDAGPARVDESEFRAATQRLHWCASQLTGSGPGF